LTCARGWRELIFDSSWRGSEISRQRETDRERDREREREGEKQRDRDRETERQRDRDRDRETERDRDRGTGRDRDRDIDRATERDRYRDRETETETERGGSGGNTQGQDGKQVADFSPSFSSTLIIPEKTLRICCLFLSFNPAHVSSPCPDLCALAGCFFAISLCCSSTVDVLSH
jgi:hypothetical protein